MTPVYETQASFLITDTKIECKNGQIYLFLMKHEILWNTLNAGELTAISIVQRQEYFLDPQCFLRYHLQQQVPYLSNIKSCLKLKNSINSILKLADKKHDIKFS